MRRVVVVGTSGSGKTTFAAGLAARLGCPHVEIDALHWGPGWTPAPREVLRARVDAATAGPCWVADGNYRSVRHLTWGRADTLVWLDYPLPLVMARLVRRTLRRMLRREELWGTGNREEWGNAVFARDSLFRWAYSSHRHHRREYPVLLAQEYPHLSVRRFCSPGAAARWLAALPSPIALASVGGAPSP